MKPLTVVLADDHVLVRTAMRKLLESLVQVPVRVVGEAGSGEEALDLVSRFQPDLVLMDISMDGMNGIEATGTIRKEQPGTRVLILSMHATETHVTQALKAGASGYLLKDAAAVELELALAAVQRGGTYLSPRASQSMVEHYVEGRQAGTASTRKLTARQHEILRLIAEGHSTKQIAHTLGISPKTVETHRAQVMKRLEIGDVAGLVRYAIRTGLISADK